jgi:hypothetical protein
MIKLATLLELNKYCEDVYFTDGDGKRIDHSELSESEAKDVLNRVKSAKGKKKKLTDYPLGKEQYAFKSEVPAVYSADFANKNSPKKKPIFDSIKNSLRKNKKLAIGAGIVGGVGLAGATGYKMLKKDSMNKNAFEVGFEAGYNDMIKHAKEEAIKSTKLKHINII